MKQAICNKALGEGFTLIEVIITVFVLAVGIIAVLQMFPLGVQVEKSAQMTSVATQLAQARMEEIISTSYDNISSKPKQKLDSPFSAFSRETEVTYFDPDNPQVTPSEDKGIKKIKVTVSWGVSLKKVELFSLIDKR